MLSVCILCVWLESTSPKHSCLVSEVGFSAAERQSVTLQYLWTVFRGWCWVLSFVLTILHILAYITSVWQQAIVCWAVCSPRESSCSLFNVPSKRFVGMQVHNNGYTNIRSPASKINIIPPLLDLAMQIVWVVCAKLGGRCQWKLCCQPITVEVCKILFCRKQWTFISKKFKATMTLQTE